MKLKKLFIAGIIIAAFTTSVSAQGYSKGFGARLGYDNGLTLKSFIAPSSAFEGILSASPNHFQLTGLYEYQQPVPDAPNLDWYLGLGAHLGSIYKKGYKGDKFMLGFDIIAGMEYIFPKAPFTISLDWKPSYNFVGDWNDYWYAGFALSLRYTFR